MTKLDGLCMYGRLEILEYFNTVQELVPDELLLHVVAKKRFLGILWWLKEKKNFVFSPSVIKILENGSIPKSDFDQLT